MQSDLPGSSGQTTDGYVFQSPFSAPAVLLLPNTTMWNVVDQRAVVPPSYMSNCRDVLYPSPLDAFGSPYPLGLGIYNCPTDEMSSKQPLPLFYVSPRVAADRAPSAHATNNEGVGSGWYAVAEPGPFEVRITRVNAPFPCTWPENLMTTHLFVDGVCTNDSRVFHESRQIYGESAILGFVERMAFSSTGSVQKDVRRFEFGRAQAEERGWGAGGEGEEGDEGNVDAATICLEAMVGVGVYSDQVHHAVNEFGYEGRQGVSEKEVTKDGKSLEVKVDGDRIPEKRGASKYRAVRERQCPEASVTVFVRERTWMRSRRLIDDLGRPCTYAMYLELLSNDIGPSGVVNGVGSPVAIRSAVRRAERPRALMRPRTQPEVIDLETSSTAETEVIDVDSNVIDLT